MGAPAKPAPVQFFCGVIFDPEFSLEPVINQLEEVLGAVDFTSAVFDFDYTDYYEPEMGVGLKKVFYAFEALRPPDELAAIKLRTNAIEERAMRPATGGGQGRIFNLDPGYLDQYKMVLATTKNNNHRVYLGQGIYAESTLAFVNKAFRPWPWTYPDYGSDAYAGFLMELRKRYLAKLRREPRP